MSHYDQLLLTIIDGMNEPFLLVVRKNIASTVAFGSYLQFDDIPHLTADSPPKLLMLCVFAKKVSDVHNFGWLRVSCGWFRTYLSP